MHSLTPTQVQSLFHKHSLDGRVPRGLTLKRILPDTPFGPIKLRAYPSEAEASARLQMINTCRRAGLLLPPVLGAHERYIVFAFLHSDGSPPAKKTLHAIGRTLGTLNTRCEESVTAEDFLNETASWLENTGRAGLLSPGLNPYILEHLRRNMPPNLPTGLDYWDAMPHNFSWQAGKFMMLDEKHLRHSFRGVGLVKPMLVLPGDEWGSVLAGYEEISESGFFRQNSPFLTYYYFLAALNFYTYLSDAKRIIPAQNTRLLRYRRELLNRTDSLPRSARILAETKFLLRHWTSLPFLAKYTLRRKQNTSHDA